MRRPRLATTSILVSVLAAWALSACGASDAEPPPAGEVNSAQAPEFEGPYAVEFAEFYGSTTSDFARQVLADGQITDAEYAEMEERFRDCLEGEGISFSGFGSDGSYSATDAPNGGDTYEIVKECEGVSGADVIGALHDIMASNPQNIDVSIIMAECLVGKGVVPGDYEADDYSKDVEERFLDPGSLPGDLRDALMSCSDNPLDVDGG